MSGYYKADGTYVESYWRTVANDTVTDNLSYNGNTVNSGRVPAPPRSNSVSPIISTAPASGGVVLGGSAGDNISGSLGNDYLFGYEGDDTLYGGSGLNYIDGGEGNDTLVRSVSKSSATAINYNGFVYVGDSAGYDKTTGIEYIRFSDQTVSAATIAPPFDPLAYLAANRDLAAAFGTNGEAALGHYLTVGGRERRSTTFNVDGYLAVNSDLATAFGGNTMAATQHYITTGRLEGRSTSFNAMSYIAANPDLIAAFGTNTTAAALHYATAGRLENRATTFNATAYLSRNPDVQRALGTSELAAATHYVTNGYREGRSAAPLASTSTRSAMGLEPAQQSTTLAAGW
ncbi:hypothetical protein FZ983_17130 [Azospirillum sp. B21]|uniref:calcium-binding protein n=1 Tax=Azospirillum sp. B21 TaxID=2607496 RepID=UPI0011EE1543|nr:hypothetical protein [Azospirillum sp. B21]KAA0579046.1 hypothetical protein FZ983_17130 [Azospirillum sp. B21]